MNLCPTKLCIIMSLNTPRDEEWRLFEQDHPETSPEAFQTAVPNVWVEDNPPGLAVGGPIIIELKIRTQPQQQRQYVILQEAQLGIQAHLQRLKKAGTLIEC